MGFIIKMSILETKLAKVEFLHDQLIAERQHIDHLLRKVGFDEGIETLKIAACELIDSQE